MENKKTQRGNQLIFLAVFGFLLTLALGFFGGIAYVKSGIGTKTSPTPIVPSQHGSVNLPVDPNEKGVQAAVQQFQIVGTLQNVTEIDKKQQRYRLSITTPDNKAWIFDINNAVTIISMPKVLPSLDPKHPVPPFTNVQPGDLKQGDSLRILYTKDLTHPDSTHVLQISLVK